MFENLIDAPITLGLIIANVAASLYAFQNREFQDGNLLWVGAMRQRNEWHRIVTSGFLHGGPGHLMLNMYGLLIFGPPIENALGAMGYLFLYMASLLAGNIWELVDNWNNPQYRALGASGAISGVVLSFCLFAPFATLLFLFVLPMWAIFFGLAFIGISYYMSLKEGPGMMIAHGAHLGGALAGIVATLIVRPDVWGTFTAQVMAKFG